MRRPTPWVLLSVAVAVALPTALAAQAPGPEVESAWADVVANHHRASDAAGIVGTSLALVADGRVVAFDAHGQESLAEERPVDEATIYHWASITKTFTAVALLQLRDRGLVSLDDPVVRWVPELRAVHDPHGDVEGITLRHLLSHSAGFRSPTWPWAGGEDWHPHEPTEWSQLVAMMPYTRLHFRPGERFNYSNPGIVFLGRVVEAVSGDPFEAYVEKNVLRPLGMDRSYFDGTPWLLRDDRSDNYRVVEGRPVAQGTEFNTGITVSNGGLNAPVGDLVRWMAFLGGGEPEGGCALPGGAGLPCAELHERVLARASLEEMWREVVPTGDEAPGLGREAMGLSFFLYEVDGHRLVGHTGSQKSFRTFFLLDPGARVAALGAWNTAGGDETGPDTRALLAEVRSRLARDVFPLFRRGTRASAGR